MDSESPCFLRSQIYPVSDFPLAVGVMMQAEGAGCWFEEKNGRQGNIQLLTLYSWTNRKHNFLISQASQTGHF